jgi:peptide/nickel transport system ATP-binding protein
MNMSGASIMALTDIRKDYRLRTGMVQRLFSARRPSVAAVDGVSLDVPAGSILGLVGESGSGKSTLAQIMVGLVPPTAGVLRYRGADLRSLSAAERTAYRRGVQMVFQDTSASLNPRKRVGRALSEALAACGVARAERPERIAALMAQVGLDATLLRRYPHELSGGQRQRIGIARALATEPELLVADEPVSSLDVSLQGQVINLVAELNSTLGLTIVLISHDLSIVARICDRIAVMQAGRLVETGAPAQVLFHPQNAYTRRLLVAVPKGRRRPPRSEQSGRVNDPETIASDSD